jgi:hypothetical protein
MFFNDNPYRHTTHLIRKDKYVWEAFFNNNFKEPYKYELIDSLDMYRSGYVIDTVNHWLDEVE